MKRSELSAKVHSQLKGEVKETPGQRLSKAREAVGFSREDIARQLRLSPSVIVALEEDQYTKIAAPVYVKGYLRAYAKFLQLSIAVSNVLLDDFERLLTLSRGNFDKNMIENSSRKQEVSMASFYKNRWVNYTLGLIVAVSLIFFMWGWYFKDREKKSSYAIFFNRSAKIAVPLAAKPRAEVNRTSSLRERDEL